MQGQTLVRQSDGSEMLEEIRQPLFDTVIQAIAEAPDKARVFFSNVTGKNKALTNLLQPNILERANSYQIRGMGFDSFSYDVTKPDLLPLMAERSYLNLRVGTKDYWTAPTVYVCGRLWQQGYAAQIAGGANIEKLYQQYGDSAVQAASFQEHPIEIPELLSFKVDWVADTSNFATAELTLATPAIATYYRMSFKGVLRRPRQ